MKGKRSVSVTRSFSENNVGQYTKHHGILCSLSLSFLSDSNNLPQGSVFLCYSCLSSCVHIQLFSSFNPVPVFFFSNSFTRQTTSAKLVVIML